MSISSDKTVAMSDELLRELLAKSEAAAKTRRHRCLECLGTGAVMNVLCDVCWGKKTIDDGALARWHARRQGRPTR